MWAILLWLHRQRACQRPLQPGPPCDLFFHLTCHDLWCYNCNSYKTSNPWLATIKPLTTITKDKLIKLEQATAGSVQVDGSRVADVNLHQEGQAVSRQLGRPAQNKPKITTLENMLLHLNGTASFSHYNMAISQPKSERIGSTGASVQALVHAKCFAKVPIHSHANTCYLNGILQVLAHLPHLPSTLCLATHSSVSGCGNLHKLAPTIHSHHGCSAACYERLYSPFVNPIPKLSGKRLNIEALSIALFSFLPSHALGDLHDAHEIQMALLDF